MRHRIRNIIIWLIILGMMLLTACQKNINEKNSKNISSVYEEQIDNSINKENKNHSTITKNEDESKTIENNDSVRDKYEDKKEDKKEEKTSLSNTVKEPISITEQSEDKKYTLKYSAKNDFVSLTIPKNQWDTFIKNDYYSKMPNQENRGMKISQEWSNFIYNWANGEYDFIVYVLNTDSRPDGLPMNGYYQAIQNDIVGIGTGGFGKSLFNYSNLYGDTDSKLQGIIYITHNDVLYDGPILHELMHRWGNYILDSDYGMCHWGNSDIYGRLGGYEKIIEKDGQSLIKTYKRYWGGPYAPFELYLMGLIPKEEVPDITITKDYSARIVDETDWNRVDGKDITVDGKINTKTYTIDQIINGAISNEDQKVNIGERIPSYKDSKKQFNILFINVDYDNMMETEIESMNNQIRLLCYEGEYDDKIYNFWEACKGKGSIESTIYLK